MVDWLKDNVGFFFFFFFIFNQLHTKTLPKLGLNRAIFHCSMVTVTVG